MLQKKLNHMSGLGCKICRDLMLDYVDGKLDRELMTEYRKHLSISQVCANEADRMSEFFKLALPRELPDTEIPDPGNFLIAINQGIERRNTRHVHFAGSFARPAIIIPVLSATILLIVCGILFIPFSGPTQTEDTMFSGLITESDLNGMTDFSTLTPLLNDILLSDLSTTSVIITEDIAALEDPATLDTSIDLSLLDDVTYSSVVSASLDYISPDDVLEQLPEREAAQLVNTLENQTIMLL
ncbi:MAG: zf-HC2 domain-containing protein [Bacteroidota bacterium]